MNSEKQLQNQRTCVSSTYSTYLQGGDSVIVQSGHLLLCQGVSCLIIDLKTCVELQHVQQLQRKDNNTS